MAIIRGKIALRTDTVVSSKDEQRDACFDVVVLLNVNMFLKTQVMLLFIMRFLEWSCWPFYLE